jgi:hypothetical protein
MDGDFTYTVRLSAVEVERLIRLVSDASSRVESTIAWVEEHEDDKFLAQEGREWEELDELGAKLENAAPDPDGVAV